MIITLTPEQERIVDEQLRLGRYQTAEDVVTGALQALHGTSRADGDTRSKQSEAVLEMLRFIENNRVTLGDISVKDLICEGHRV